MRSLRLLSAAALLAAPATAQAAQKPITGSLAKNGYTVIALSYDGKASSAHVAGGKFRVVPPAAKVTLSLRDASGEYAGPVVVGAKGKRAVLGVRAGAKLGRLRLAKGVARAKVARGRTDRSRTAVTKRGRPIGAGRFGLVRARATGGAGTGGDRDLDGVASAFDIDDDGDLVLDNTDGTGRARARQVPPPAGGGPAPAPEEQGLRLFSNFHFALDETLNANAGGVTREQIDAAMTAAGSFVGLVFFLPEGIDEAELDCGGLSYCSPGGTGRTSEPYPAGTPFPDQFDADGDGLGTISRGVTRDFQLRTFAPSSAIGSGDTFVEQLPDGSQLSGSLNYMFNTTPAVRSYVTGDGTSTTVAYPASATALGTIENPLPLTPDAAGDYTLELTMWRPQRAAIPEAGEPDGFVDIGGLKWQAMMASAPQPIDPGAGGGGSPAPGVSFCNTETGFTSADANLVRSSQPGFLLDQQGDAPSDPSRTVTAKVNFTRCLAQGGQELKPGFALGWEVQANSVAGDVSAQGWWVCVPPAGRSDCKRSQPQPPQPGPPPPAQP
jgi:hypothetical protein